MKKRLYVRSANSDVVYISDMDIKPFFEKNKNFLEFPGLFFTDREGYDSEYKVYYNNTTENQGIFFEDNTCIINYPIEELNQSSIVYMGYVMIEKQRAERHSLTSHSACVDYNGVGALILGKEGSGKTTTAIKMCESHGFFLVANDLSIIEYSDPKNINVIEGTKYIFLRKESIKRNLPQLLDKFGDDKVDSWLNKVKVLPEQIGIRAKKSTKLKRAFIVHVDNSQKELKVTNGNTMVNKLYLNENFHKYKRNACTTFLNKDFEMAGFVPSFDTRQYYNERVALIDGVLNGLRLEYVSGNIEDVSAYIQHEMEKELQRTGETDRYKSADDASIIRWYLIERSHKWVIRIL